MKDTVNTTLFDLLLYAMIDLKSLGGKGSKGFMLFITRGVTKLKN